jgi:hypothetical protein
MTGIIGALEGMTFNAAREGGALSTLSQARERG